ncbi:unnamed protein product [Linum trigynum]|uniref:Uncharacterized protein n=1 Tax=Linum trigynum TaxID=586398 RepID=A0AAV2FC78_9ROSI
MSLWFVPLSNLKSSVFNSCGIELWQHPIPEQTTDDKFEAVARIRREALAVETSSQKEMQRLPKLPATSFMNVMVLQPNTVSWLRTLENWKGPSPRLMDWLKQ